LKDHVEKCADAAAQHIGFLLEEEQEPFTMNEHYFMEYRSKFLAYYREARLRAQSQFIRNLENREDEDIMNAMNDAISSVTRMGLEAANASLFANLLPADPMDPAIGIMAEVRAYFQGSHSSLYSSFVFMPDPDLYHSRIQAICRQCSNGYR
jgi:protein subunit release factor A